MDTKEYNQTVTSFADRIYRFVLKNVPDDSTAHDIVQDSYEKLWIHHLEIRAEKAKSYLFTTAYHRFIDLKRKDKRLDFIESFTDKGLEQVHNRQYNDVMEILNEAVKQLPHDQRSVLLLRDYEGYSYHEIAEITKLSESQVKVYIYRARVYLKKYIGNPDILV